MKGHFVLCGLGQIGLRVLTYLKSLGNPIVVIDNHCSPNDSHLEGATLICGDCREKEVLEKANIREAAGVLILTSNDLINLSTGLMIYRLNPEVRMVIRMFNQGLIPNLGPAMTKVSSLSTSALAAPVMALIASMGDVLGAITLDNGKRMQVTEVPIRANSPYNNVPLAHFLRQQDIFLVAHLPKGENYHFIDNLDLEKPLSSGDRVVICGENQQIASVKASSEDQEPDLRWANFFLRHWRIFRRTVAQVDLPVKICALVLILVVLFSTLLFHLTMRNDSLPDAFYRTISIMATMADMGMEDLQPQGWQKVFVGFLRLSGAALIAAFTAILTNYLVRANLGSALEIRRIPEKGHIVVCGLGNVGFRVAEELASAGEKVVVIERSNENGFITTARRKGIAVIIGDAAVRELLEEAHVGAAKAVVAATGVELANLQIALLAREINPDQRVILRLTDPRLAQTLKETVDLKFPLSIPDLAAPAFIAALFGDRVHSVFFLDGHLLAIIDLKIDEDDTLLNGQPVRALVVDFNIQPICLVKGDGIIKTNPLGSRLESGDKLTAIVNLKDLQKLFRREKPHEDYLVEVVRFPLPARDYLVQMLRTCRGLSGEEAEQEVETLPLKLTHPLSRGYAEDVLYLLHRERVEARVVNCPLQGQEGSA